MVICFREKLMVDLLLNLSDEWIEISAKEKNFFFVLPNNLLRIEIVKIKKIIDTAYLFIIIK